MRGERLSALDASFLAVEDGVSHMHIGSIALFEGPPPSTEELHEMVLAKLPLVPRYRQLVRFVPLGVGRPVWVEDLHFNIEYHLRRSALPAPGGEQELQRLVGRVMSQQLDRTKPLWEMWVVERVHLADLDAPWALISKTHHCMVDGVSASDLLSVMLDTDPRGSVPPIDQRRVGSPPGDLELLAGALGAGVGDGVRAARALLRPRVLAGRGADMASGLLRMRGVLRAPPSSSLNGPLGPNRRWCWAQAPLADVKAVKRTLGGTVNDVVLACITEGFRRLLLSRGESVQRPVRTLVPVSVRAPAEHGVYDNRVSAIFAELPVGIADPVDRLRAITAQMADLKESKEALAGEALTALGGFAPPMLLALGERLGTRVPQHSINTVTTNVPGPQQPLYGAGRRMLRAYGYVPLGGHVRVGVAIYSYDGHVGFGVTGDYDTAQDIDVLCAGIEDGMAQLSEICGTARQGEARRGEARKGEARKGSSRTGALR